MHHIAEKQNSGLHLKCCGMRIRNPGDKTIGHMNKERTKKQKDHVTLGPSLTCAKSRNYRPYCSFSPMIHFLCQAARSSQNSLKHRFLLYIKSRNSNTKTYKISQSGVSETLKLRIRIVKYWLILAVSVSDLLYEGNSRISSQSRVCHKILKSTVLILTHC
jgi:hypothetical protein